MKALLIAIALLLGFGAHAQTVHPRTYPAHKTISQPRPASRPVAAPAVYVCGGGSAYAYHSSETCAGLNRCSHGVSPVSVAEAEGMGRRP